MGPIETGVNPRPDDDRARSRLALLALGFRPFYLLAGIFGAAGVLLWAAQFAGWLGSAVAFSGAPWHAHEMLFGYAFAVITGFLFTAVRNWTQRPTPTGAALAGLALLWLAGRVLALTPWAAWSAATDTAFAFGVALGIGRPLIASGNRRNYFFIVLVVALGVANLSFHAALHGFVPFSTGAALTVGLDVVLFIIAIVAGRVVPMFTNNALRGAGARRVATLEYFALGSVLALIAADLAGAAVLAAAIAAIGAIAHGARLALWAPWATRRTPLLWILHASYAWIVVHLALRAAAGLDWVTPSLATHALTIGGVGGMTLGMMTRSALGHSGRPLTARGYEVASYILIQIAAAARVLVPIALPAWHVAGMALSGLAWSAAFIVFVVAYWPILTRSRIDGQPG